jgi:hypothetical protein
MFRWLTIALLAAAFVPLSTAQMRGGRPVSLAHGTGWHHGARHFARGGFLGSPFLYPDYDTHEPYFVEEAPPQVVLVRPAAMDDSPTKPKPAPLLIEWQGDRYVRFGGAQETEARATSTHPDYVEPRITKPPMPAKQKEGASLAAQELPRAVLVYRDGHREEISDYAIADGVIYLQSAYWQNGYSTKSIPLSALDPVATMQANLQRDAKFMLPSASNVVIASF